MLCRNIGTSPRASSSTVGGARSPRGYRRVIAPPRMLSAEDYLTKVGFRSKGDAMVLELG